MLLPQTIKLKFCLFNSSFIFGILMLLWNPTNTCLITSSERYGFMSFWPVCGWANRMQIYLAGKCSLSGVNNSINLNPALFTGGYLQIQEADMNRASGTRLPEQLRLWSLSLHSQWLITCRNADGSQRVITWGLILSPLKGSTCTHWRCELLRGLVDSALCWCQQCFHVYSRHTQQRLWLRSTFGPTAQLYSLRLW